MTLIADFHPKGGRAILADLLASTPSGDPDFTPPTRAYLPPEELNKSAQKPYSLWRKVIEVNEDLAIVCAGNSVKAEALARRARVWFNQKPMTEQTVDDFLDALYYEHIPDFCAMLVPSKHSWVRVIGNVPKKHCSFAGEYRAAGTGSPVFDWLVTNFIPRTGQQTAPDIDALRIASELLAREINFRETLKRQFGAGFEVLYVDQNGWTRVDDVMHVFGNIFVNDNSILPVKYHPHLLRQWYEEDRLYIASMSTVGIEAFGLPYSGYVATDVQGKQRPSERILPVRPNYLCLHHAFWFEDQAFPSVFVAKGQGIDELVVFEKTASELKLNFTPRLNEQLTDRLRAIKAVRREQANSTPECR
jgi:hypothetical protein